MSVPGPPAAVLAAILRADLAHPYDASDRRQRHMAWFSQTAMPDLPSLITEGVFLPANATFDADVTVTGWLASQGRGAQGVIGVSANYVTTPAVAAVLADAAAGALTIALGDATQPGWISPGQEVTVIKTDTSANAVTVTGSNGQLIGGSASLTLSGQNAYTTVLFDGANWQIWSGYAVVGTTPSGNAGGDLGGTYPNPAVTATHLTAALPVTQGGTGLSGAGSAGQVLITNTAGNLAYANAPVDWINAVTAYGADPTGGSDSTAAIQGALNAVHSAGAGVVYLPAGTYTISAALTIYPGTALTGAGVGATHLTQSSTTAAGITGTDVSAVALCGLRLSGPGSGSGIGVQFARSANPSTPYLDFRDLKVDAWGGNGIDLSNPAVTTLTGVVAQANGGHGFAIHGVSGGAAGTSCALSGCYANGNTGHGYDLDTMTYCHLSGCAADSNGYGYYLTACEGVTLAGCGAEATITDSFVLNGGVGNTITGCFVYTNAHYGIHVTAGEAAATLTGCTDNTPAAGAVNFIITDTGTSAALVNCRNITANSIAAGTASVLSDTTGELSVAGTSYLSTINAYGTVNARVGVDVPVAGYGLAVAEGANAKQGTAVLAAGTVTVANTAVTANSRIFLTVQAPGGTPGSPYISARTAGTSFTITSTSATDTSTVAYEIIEPG